MHAVMLSAATLVQSSSGGSTNYQSVACSSTLTLCMHQQRYNLYLFLVLINVLFQTSFKCKEKWERYYGVPIRSDPLFLFYSHLVMVYFTHQRSPHQYITLNQIPYLIRFYWFDPNVPFLFQDLIQDTTLHCHPVWHSLGSHSFPDYLF